MISRILPARANQIGIVYAIAVLILGAYLNYIIPYTSAPVTSPDKIELVLWSLLYVPLGLLVVAANWNITEFGFSINQSLGFAIVVFLPLCSMATSGVQISWQSAALEAFARTGEEIFFRGFLFALLIRIFHSKSKPWMWAIVISSLLFTLIHTQTYQSSFFSDQSSMSRAYRIIERLLNLFLIALILALLRYWTHSILPSAIIHSALNGGILTIPFCLIIYFIIALWAYLRKEEILFIPGANRS